MFVHLLVFLLGSPQASSSPQGGHHILHQLWLMTDGAESFFFQGQCVSTTRGQQAAWTQHGQIAAAHGKQYVPVITRYIQGFSVQEELCPVTHFQKGRNRCKRDRAGEVLWAAVQLPLQQIPSLISHHCYSASAVRKQHWGPRQELSVQNHPSAQEISFIRDEQECKSFRRKLPKAAATPARGAGSEGRCP